jgi:hypothetical protein
VPQTQRGIANYFLATLSEDWSWGCSTARQRVVYRLQRFAHLAGYLDHLPSVTDAAARLHHILASRWGAGEYIVPFYPAFSSRGADVFR